MPTAVVTGAGRGIGLAVARDLARDHHVIMTVRDPAAASVIPGAHVEKLDVSDPDSIAAFAARIAGPLDVLVNNAGVYREPARDIWAVNVRGPLLLTRALAGKLAKGARVVMVTSGLGELASQPDALARKLRDPSLSFEDILAMCRRSPGERSSARKTQVLRASRLRSFARIAAPTSVVGAARSSPTRSYVRG